MSLGAMKPVLRIGAVFCGLALGVGLDQSRNLVIDTDEYHYIATFNSDRISAVRFRELLLFSPYEFGVEGWEVAGQRISAILEETPSRIEKNAIALSLDVCIGNDSRYRVCGSRDLSDPNFIANAEVNVGLNQQAMAALDELAVPAELSSIVQQFRDSLAFYSTVEQRRLEYLRSGDPQVLSAPIGAIDPSTECAAEIKRLETAVTPSQRYELSLYGWQNCLNSAWNRISPEYPQQAWRNFLLAYGVSEHFTNKGVDD